MGARGAQIPLAARIFALADVFDALTSKRPYKEPFPLDEALEIIAKSAGVHFDPALVERFNALAPGLHARYGGREDPGLREELLDAVRGDFPSESDAMNTSDHS